MCDGRRPAVQHHLASDDAHGGGDVVQLDVVQHERAREFPVRRHRCAHEDRRIRDRRVDDRFGTYRLTYREVRSGTTGRSASARKATPGKHAYLPSWRQSTCRQIEPDLS